MAMGRLGIHGFSYVFFHGGFIKLIGFAFLDMDGILRTVAKAGTKAVAKIVCRQAGLAINDLDGAFSTCGYTEATTVAFIFVDMNDIPFHG